MSDSFASAVHDGTYDQVRSVSQVRDILESREEGKMLTEARWWASEHVKFRIYLVAECWDQRTGRDDNNALVMPIDARSEMAARPWQRIPEKLRHSIVNEMGRLCRSANVLKGQ